MRFIKAARGRGVPVIVPMLKSLADQQARKSGIDGFTASEGWLGKVKARHGISGSKLSGEAGSVNKFVIKNWKEGLSLVMAWLGKKEKILLIGATHNPSSLKGTDKSKSPVIYRAQNNLE